MTWEQWVNSKYNVVENPYTGSGSVNNGNWYIHNDNVDLTNDVTNAISVKNIDGDFILYLDKIIENYAYIANSSDQEPT